MLNEISEIPQVRFTQCVSQNASWGQMAHTVEGLTQEHLLKDHLQRPGQCSGKSGVGNSLLPSVGLRVRCGSASLNAVRTVAVGKVT